MYIYIYIYIHIYIYTYRTCPVHLFGNAGTDSVLRGHTSAFFSREMASLSARFPIVPASSYLRRARI